MKLADILSALYLPSPDVLFALIADLPMTVANARMQIQVNTVGKRAYDMLTNERALWRILYVLTKRVYALQETRAGMLVRTRLVTAISVVYDVFLDDAGGMSCFPCGSKHPRLWLPASSTHALRMKFKSRVATFTEFTLNGMEPELAAKLVCHWHALQPRNINQVASVYVREQMRKLVISYRERSVYWSELWMSDSYMYFNMEQNARICLNK